MRFSVITALCAAPLALAGGLQHDFVARGAVGLEVSEAGPNPKGSQKNTDNNSQKNNENNDKKDNNKEGQKHNAGNNGGGNNVVIVQQSTVNEVVIIWVNNGGGAATTTVTDTVTVTAGAAGTVAAVGPAATHNVTVGGVGGLVYSPESVVAAVGDMVIFTFMSQNHTVTQSAFTEPCKKLATGMDSGFMANVNNTVSPPPQMAMQVTVDTPIWFYCKQKAHCGKGMTFSINPTADKTQATFKSMAIAQNGTGAASPITGGAPSSIVAPPPPAATEAVAAAPPPPPPASPPAAAVPSAVAGVPMAGGQGTINSGGACSCACLCGTAAFPNEVIQGLGAFGGISGRMPMASLEA